MNAIKRQIDRTEIVETIARYARGIDRRDWALVRSVFFDDATSHHGDFKGSPDEFVSWISERHATIARSGHYLCNCAVDFVSANQAVVETYFIARMRMGPNAGGHRTMLAKDDPDERNVDLIVEVCGRYADRFENRHGEWRIAQRITIFDFSDSHSAPALRDNPAWAHGVRGPDDPLYRHFAPDSVQETVSRLRGGSAASSIPARRTRAICPRALFIAGE